MLLAHAHGLAGERRVSSRLALRVEAVAVQREDEALLWRRFAGGHFACAPVLDSGLYYSRLPLLHSCGANVARHAELLLANNS